MKREDLDRLELDDPGRALAAAEAREAGLSDRTRKWIRAETVQLFREIQKQGETGEGAA